jgi:hypothetical protein
LVNSDMHSNNTWHKLKSRCRSKKHDDTSALSMRSMKQIADMANAIWQSSRAERRRA